MFQVLRLSLADRSPLVQRAASAAWWALVGSLGARFASLLTSLLAARLLGGESFGQLGIITSTTGMFGIFAGLGMGVTATKYVAEFRRSDPKRTGRIIALTTILGWLAGSVLMIVVFIAAPAIAAGPLTTPRLVGPLRIASCLLMLGAGSAVQTGALAGFESFRSLAQLNAMGGILSVVGVVIGIHLSGVEGAVGGMVVAQAVACILNARSLRREMKAASIVFQLRQCAIERKIAWRYSMPAMISGAMVVPVVWAAQCMLVHSAGYAEQALYTAAAQWRTLVGYIPSTLVANYLPIAASLQKGDSTTRRRLMWFTIMASSGISLAVAAGCSLLAPWILHVYGRDFLAGRGPFLFMMGTAVADSVNHVLVPTIMASGRAWSRLLSNGIWAALVLTCTALLVPNYGAAGLAAGLFLAQTLHLTIQVPLALRALGTASERAWPQDLRTT